MRAARFTVITPECVRMEYSDSGRFIDDPSLFAAARHAGRADHPTRIVAAGDAPATIDTGRVRIEYTPDGRPFSPHNLRATIRFGDFHGDATWQPGQHQRGNLGGALRSLDGVRGPVATPDGVLSRDGWYLLDDSGTPLLRDGWAAERPQDGSDWYLFGYGRDYRAALRALMAVGGPVPLPRRAMMGSWYSRYWPYTSDDYRGIVEGYAEHGFPLDVLVMDMDWHRSPPRGSDLPPWTGWSWNRELLPDAEALLAWVKERGLAVTLNLHPADGVRWFEDRYEAFMRRLGRDPATRETVPFDAGNRNYMEALLKEVHAPLERDGVDFWWMDWQQDEWARSVRGLANVGWMNAVYAGWGGGGDKQVGRWGGGEVKGTESERGIHLLTSPPPHLPIRQRPAPFGRWGGWGDHRHPVHFSGDVHSGWRAFAYVVPFTLASAGSGCYFWSHDIGGHFGARDEEAMTRWVQFGAISAALRVHSARSARLDRRPWLCAEPYRGAIRAAYLLRSRLMPTIVTAARVCHDEAIPLLRPMCLDHPWDERAYRYRGQYRLGDLLVAPIVSPGAGDRKIATTAVWFPEVEESGRHPRGQASGHQGWWHHLETGDRYRAGTEAIVAAAIDEIPLFAPAGVPILMQPPTMRMGSEPMRTLVMRCFPGEAGTAATRSVYEDDGVSTGYMRGEYARTAVTVRWMGAGLTLEIGLAVGAFAGQPERRGCVIELGAVRAVSAARVAGRAVEVDLVNGIARVNVPDRSIRERVVVEVEFVAAAKTTSSEYGIGVVVENGGYRLYDSFGEMQGGKADVRIVDRLGAAEAEVWSGAAHVEPGVAEWVGEPGPSLAEPPLGVRASRLVEVRFVRAGKRDSLSTRVRTRLRPLRAWRVAGPFRFHHTRPIDDQREGPELGPTDAAAVYRGRDGEEVRWQHAQSSEAWPVDLRRHFHGGSIMAYAVTHVWSPVEQAANLELESGDRIEAWVNQEKVFSLDTGDTMDSAAGSAKIMLRAGWNRVAAKVSEGGGGFGFSAAIDGQVEVRESAEGEGG